MKRDEKIVLCVLLICAFFISIGIYQAVKFAFSSEAATGIGPSLIWAGVVVLLALLGAGLFMLVQVQWFARFKARNECAKQQVYDEYKAKQSLLEKGKLN